MSSVLVVLFFITVAVVVTLIVWWSAPKHKPPKFDPETVEVLVELHRIRRRFDVFLFKVEVERRTQHAERGLRKELRERL